MLKVHVEIMPWTSQINITLDLSTEKSSLAYYLLAKHPVPNFQSNSVLNQEVFQEQFSTDSESVHVTFGCEIL